MTTPTTTIMLAIVVVVVVVASGTTMTTTFFVYAQAGVTSPGMSSPPSSTTTTNTATTQQIIDEAHAACTQVTQADVLAPLCITVVHESPTTIVLTGDLLIVQFGGGYGDNPIIWQAVDKFKAQGYTLNSAVLTGQGSQGNPHSWYIVMSK